MGKQIKGAHISFKYNHHQIEMTEAATGGVL